MGHVVCHDGILMDPDKILIIVNLPPPAIVKKLRMNLGHTGYYKKFITGYVEVITPMEKLLNKDVKFQWTEQCQEILDVPKNKMVTTPILNLPNWKKEFHVHVDVSSIALHIVLAQPDNGSINHPISFNSLKL